MRLRRHGLAGQFALRIARFSQFRRVRTDILCKLRDQECVDYLGLVVRHAKIKPLVKRQRVARPASICEFHRRHQLTPACRFHGLQNSRVGWKSPLLFIAGRGRSIVRIGIRQIRISRTLAVAIPTFELHRRPGRPPPDRFHVNRVVHLNCRRIPHSSDISTRRRKLRMPIVETRDVCRVPRRPVGALQVAVARRAALIARRNQVYSSPMFRVARRTTKRGVLRRVMQRRVVTSQTSGVTDLCRKRARRLHMASRTLRLQHRVRLAHPPARIHTRIPRESVPRNPNQGQHRQPRTQPKLRALKPSRSLEIIQVDPLRQFLSCSCSRHASRL